VTQPVPARMGHDDVGTLERSTLDDAPDETNGNITPARRGLGGGDRPTEDQRVALRAPDALPVEYLADVVSAGTGSVTVEPPMPVSGPRA